MFYNLLYGTSGKWPKSKYAKERMAFDKKLIGTIREVRKQRRKVSYKTVVQKAKELNAVHPLKFRGKDLTFSKAWAGNFAAKWNIKKRGKKCMRKFANEEIMEALAA